MVKNELLLTDRRPLGPPPGFIAIPEGGLDFEGEQMLRPWSVQQFGRTLAPALVAAGTVFAGLSLFANPAGAATIPACGTAAQTSCSATGTLALGGGTLSLTAPAQLAWSGTITGGSLSLYDSSSSDQGYQVSDLTGTGAGWHVTLSATTFTNGTHTLPDSGTFSTNGSTTSPTSTSAPSQACAALSTCTLPTDTVTYPVAITTASSTPAAVSIYNAAAGSGLGNINVSGVGWWLNVPATAYAGSYTSTVTFAIVSGP